MEKYRKTKKPKEKSIKQGLPLFIDSVHFKNTLSENLVRNVAEKNFYHQS